MPVEVRQVSMEEVLDADEIFMTGSTKRIAPITMIDNISFKIGQLTRILYDMLLEDENND